MSITRSQSYKKVVQLALIAEKLTSERMFRCNFQKRKGFSFMFGQSLKKCKSFKSSSNSFGYGSRSVSSPQSIRSPQRSKLGTSPPGSTFKDRMMAEKCPHYRQFHTGTCGTPHVCFHCGQIDHVKRFCPLLSGSGFVGQFSS